MKKKLLLTSVAALSLFAAYNTANADTNNGASVTGRVNPLTGKLETAPYSENKVVSEHTGVVPEAEQYKPATPAYNPYHGKPQAFDKDTFVRFC